MNVANTRVCVCECIYIEGVCVICFCRAQFLINLFISTQKKKLNANVCLTRAPRHAPRPSAHTPPSLPASSLFLVDLANLSINCRRIFRCFAHGIGHELCLIRLEKMSKKKKTE